MISSLMQRSNGSAAVKILLMSAFEINSTELSTGLRENTIQGFVQKPIALDELGNIVQTQIKQK